MKRILAIGAAVLACAGAVLATTWDNTVGGTNGYPAFLGRGIYTISRSVDFSSYTNTVAADDAIKMVNVPATSIVLNVSYCLSTATSNDVYARIYNGNDNSTIVDQIDTTNASWATRAIYTNPVFHVNNDDIRVGFTNAAVGHTGKIDLSVQVLDMNVAQ